MTLGQTTVAPRGLVDLCQRDAQACPGLAVSDAGLGSARAEADRAYWLARVRTVSSRQETPIAAPVATNAEIVQVAVPLQPQSSVREERAAKTNKLGIAAKAVSLKVVKPRKTDADVMTRSSTDAPSLLVAFPPPPVLVADTAVLARPRSGLTPRQWAEISRINRRVNDAMALRTDVANFGVSDLWQAPGSSAARYGDCEDYVLQKRHDLIVAGYSEDDLSIAIVDTPSGAAHAVLLLTDAEGEYVLDNLSTWILPWSATRYRWIERQAPGRPSDWVTVG